MNGAVTFRLGELVVVVGYWDSVGGLVVGCRSCDSLADLNRPDRVIKDVYA